MNFGLNGERIWTWGQEAYIVIVINQFSESVAWVIVLKRILEKLLSLSSLEGSSLVKISKSLSPVR
jgi:hypothetical protein